MSHLTESIDHSEDSSITLRFWQTCNKGQCYMTMDNWVLSPLYLEASPTEQPLACTTGEESRMVLLRRAQHCEEGRVRLVWCWPSGPDKNLVF